jgi:hypothetical protein
VSFRVDYPRIILSASTRSERLDLSADITYTYSFEYTDGSPPPAFTANYTMHVQEPGVYGVTEYWWSVDVYSGATTASEPPDPAYYAYQGTVCPASTHSYFQSSYYWSQLPSGYDPAFVYTSPTPLHRTGSEQ